MLQGRVEGTLELVHPLALLLVVVLPPLDPPILEPDLDLPLGKAERVRDFYSPPSRQVVVVVELLLELEGLETRVRLPPPAPRTPVRPWKRQKRRFA